MNKIKGFQIKEGTLIGSEMEGRSGNG